MTKTKKEDKKADKKEAKKELSLVDLVTKEHGVGSLIDMSGSSGVQVYETLSTGSLNLDHALGIGGLPRGRIVEIWGPEASGKTTTALEVVASATKAGHKAAYIDVEHALDIGYAKNIGVDLDRLFVSQPDHGEQALNILDTVVRSGQCAVCVVDSVAALVPLKELEGAIGDIHVGQQSRMMSQTLRKLTAITHVSNTLVIFINQIRMKIGVMFGSPETTPGGNALKFYSSIRLRVSRTGSVKVGEEVVANTTKVKIVKNKCSPPFKEVEFEIEFGKGISMDGEIVDLGVKQGLIVKAGAWFSLADGTKLGQGKENVKECLRADKKLRSRLVKQIRDSLKK